MIVNVSDLFDALHEIAVIARTRFGAGDDDEPSFRDIIDQLEMELFLPACARRVAMITRQEVEPDDVAGMIRLRERDGTIRPGAAGRYESHAFDQEDGEAVVPNAVLAGNLLARGRAEVELVIGAQTYGGGAAAGGSVP